MHQKENRLAPLILTVFLLTSCAPRALHVSNPADGTHVILQPRQKLVLSLDSPMANAYMWDVCAMDERILSYDDRIIKEPDSMHIQEILTFTAMNPGKTSLALAYGFPSNCLLSSYDPKLFLSLTVVVE